MSLKRLQQLVSKHVNYRTFVRYALGGVTSYVFNILVTLVLSEFAGIHYLVSFIIALVLSMIFNFIVTLKLIFRKKEDVSSKLAMYVVTVLIFSFLNVQLVKWLVDGFGIHYAIAITFSTGAIFLAKFFLYDKYVFADKKR